jgi:aspartyl protease family protein
MTLYDGDSRRNVVSDVASVSGTGAARSQGRQNAPGSHKYRESALGPWIALTLLSVGALYLLLSNDVDALTGLSQDKLAQFVAGVSILVFLSSGILASYRGHAARAARHALDWSLFFLLLVAVYSYRFELLTFIGRIANELTPEGVQISVAEDNGRGRSVRIRRQWNGHFIARAAVNGRTVNMLIDTGASTVVLRAEDARKAGLDISRLHFSVPVQTANGQSFAAPVRLNNVSIGPVSLVRVDALVARPGSLQTSLLGMSFLSRLRSYEFSGNYLTLRS